MRGRSLKRSPIEPAVHHHDWEVSGQVGASDLAKTVLLVEAMCCEELCGRSEEDFPHASCLAPRQESVQQTLCGAVLSTAMGCLDEHLAQSSLTVSDVQQCDGSDDLLAIDGDPEVAAVVLVETGNVLQIWLTVERDWNLEFGLLNRKDDRDNTISMLGPEGSDGDHGLSDFAATVSSRASDCDPPRPSRAL